MKNNFLHHKFLIALYSVVLMAMGNYSARAQKLRDVSLPGIAANYVYPDSRLNLLHFRENSGLDAATFFSSHKELTGLGNEDEMRMTHEETGTALIHHYRFQQFYKGVKIDHVSYSLHEKDGKLVSGLGKMIRGLNMDVNPAVSTADAVKIAMEIVPAEKYYWDDPQREQRLKERKKDPSATYFPQPELMIAKIDPEQDFTPENYKLMYRVPVMALQPHQPMMVFLDAKTGALIRKESTELKCSPGSVSTTFNGVKSMSTRFTGSTYESVDDCIYSLLYSYDEDGDELHDSDNNWTNNSTTKQMAITSLWSVRQATNYYAEVHNLIGFDGEGDNVEIYNNVTFPDQDCEGCNSSWEWWTDNMNIGYGNTHTSSLDDYNTLDICGHELTHGVIEESTDIDYDGESGAINESFADIFGNMVENWFEHPSSSDTSWWAIAEDRSGPGIEGDGFRDMINPNADGQPDTYHGFDWEYNTSDNNGYVHTNSGVGNHAFYLMSEGGSGENDNGDLFNVQGITHLTARFIAFDAMHFFSDSDPSYEDIRDAYLEAANLLYGSCSQEAITTGNAWSAVGVGKNNNDYAAALCGTYGDFVPETVSAIGEIRNYPYDVLNHEWLFDPCNVTIDDNAPVTLHTAGYIQLVPGFEANSGCDFTAYISACDITQLKLSGNENSDQALPGDEESNSKQGSLSLYPNPASSLTTLAFDKNLSEEVTVTIVDARGVSVFNKIINDIQPHIELRIGTTRFPKGIYFCSVHGELRNEMIQLVVQ